VAAAGPLIEDHQISHIKRAAFSDLKAAQIWWIKGSLPNDIVQGF
jgi:hypothetical protein